MFVQKIVFLVILVAIKKVVKKCMKENLFALDWIRMIRLDWAVVCNVGCSSGKKMEYLNPDCSPPRISSCGFLFFPFYFLGRPQEGDRMTMEITCGRFESMLRWPLEKLAENLPQQPFFSLIFGQKHRLFFRSGLTCTSSSFLITFSVANCLENINN